MTFEDKFPSYHKNFPLILREKFISLGIRNIGDEIHPTFTEPKSYEFLKIEAFREFLIKHCLDKAKVKEVIENKLNTESSIADEDGYMYNEGFKACAEELLKELGINDK